MKYPKPLGERGTIGFAAPSFGCAMEPYHTMFQHGLEVFQSMGHALDLGPNCYESRGVGISNTPKACGEELTEWYCREENQALISCGGGELMCQILDYVDFERIRKASPKWYMGFSDNTNFTFLLTTLCDTASIYGPCAPSFGMEPWHQSIQDAYDLLRGVKDEVTGYPQWEMSGPDMGMAEKEKNPLAPYRLTEQKVLHSFLGSRPVSKDERLVFQGRLAGGCMDCLVNLLGTCYDGVKAFGETYKEDGIIWFLESCDLNVMAMRRAIWQMQHAGWFRYVKGFLIGRPLQFGQEIMGLDHYQAVWELLAEYQVPVIMDVDLGHLPPMMPIVCGALGEVSVQGNQIKIHYKME